VSINWRISANRLKSGRQGGANKIGTVPINATAATAHRIEMGRRAWIGCTCTPSGDITISACGRMCTSPPRITMRDDVMIVRLPSRSGSLKTTPGLATSASAFWISA